MTPTITHKNNNDLSHIKTQEDLQTEIRLLKADIKIKQQHLESNWKQLPQEGLKTAAVKVMPNVLSQRVLLSAFFIIKGIMRLVKKKKTIKAKVTSNIRRTLIIMALSWFMKWRKNKKQAKLRAST